MPCPASLTARSADAVVLVCLGGKSTKESIDAAKAALGPANIVGVVVNGRDQPTVGAELAREARRATRLFPKLSRRLAERALQIEDSQCPRLTRCLPPKPRIGRRSGATAAIRLLVDSSGIGGIERHVAVLAQALRRRGYDARVLLLADHGANAWLDPTRGGGHSL